MSHGTTLPFSAVPVPVVFERQVFLLRLCVLFHGSVWKLPEGLCHGLLLAVHDAGGGGFGLSYSVLNRACAAQS